MPKKYLPALLLAAVVLAGCGGPPPQVPQAPLGSTVGPVGAPEAAPAEVNPTPSSPPAEKPAGSEPDCLSSIPLESYGRFDVAGGGWLWVTRGVCPIVTDEESRTIEFILPPNADEATVRKSLTYSGAGQLQTRYAKNDKFAAVNVTIPPGRAGEQADLRLTGPWGPDGSPVDMAFRLTRVPSARIASELRVGDGPWEPLTGVRMVPAQPLSLRFQLSGDVDPAAVRGIIEKALGKTDFRLEQPAPGTIVVIVPQPPLQITPEFWRLHAPYGRVQGGSFTLYAGDPPTVVALDPVTGRERAIGMAPPDIWSASLSPDGQWATLAVVSPENCQDSRGWLVDLTTGRSGEIPVGRPSFFSAVAWPTGRLVIASWDTVAIYHLADGRTETRTVVARTWGEPSPDGRYLLGYIKHYDRERPDWNAPITVLVYDVETGQEQTFPDAAWARVAHSGAPPLTRLFWGPDGKGILINDPVGTDPLVGGKAVLHLDPATGATAPFSQPVPDRLDWLPGPGSFSFRPQGWPIQDWGPVMVRSPGGAEQRFGEGFILGWAPDGNLLLIRWANGRRTHCEGE